MQGLITKLGNPTSKGCDMDGARTRVESVPSKEDVAQLPEQRVWSSFPSGGSGGELYKHHLFFDNAVALDAATIRDRFEAMARSVRDVLSQRWVLTEKTYERQNPRRVYCLSMEFLIGRSLANNVTNLLLDQWTRKIVQQEHLAWIDLLEQEPDAGLGQRGARPPGSVFHGVRRHTEFAGDTTTAFSSNA
jgi:starch phosphorylase